MSSKKIESVSAVRRTVSANKDASAPVEPEPDAIKTPIMDALVAVLGSAYSGPRRWVIEGYAGHIRGCNHQLHALNSAAKHRADFDDFSWAVIQTVVVARCADFGMSSDDTLRELAARIEKRALASAI